MTQSTPSLSEAFHPRTFREFKFVYPVLSRRAHGISVGVNLNPDKACNFDCIYCQVDRSKTPPENFVELPRLRQELDAIMLGLQPGGALWSEPEFTRIPAEKRRVNDIAFSGDGEPTTFKNFYEVTHAAAEIKTARGFSDAKIVIITNATGLDRPDVKKAFAFLDTQGLEIWAKLDAGTPEYFKTIDRTDFPYEKILSNIQSCDQTREIVIQSCFMKLKGQPPSEAELSAYMGRLNAFHAAGAKIKLVQIYTVARKPAYGIVSSLSNAEVDAIAARVRAQTPLNAEAFYGEVAEGQGTLGVSPESLGNN